MKTIIFGLVVISSISTTAFARTVLCQELFVSSRPAHFVAARDFYSSPVTAAILKAEESIVVEVAIRRALESGDSKNLVAVAVMDLGGLSQSDFQRLVLSKYEITANFGLRFSELQENVELSGAPSDILRFLNNPFARKTVMWIGKTRAEAYVLATRAASVNHSPDESSQESFSGIVHAMRFPRAYLEPMSSSDSNRAGPSFNEDGPKGDNIVLF